MTLELKAKSRPLPTPALNQARAQGQIPVELYGHGQKNQHFFVNLLNLQDIYQKAGSSTLIDLVINGQEPIKTIIGEVQRDPVTNRILHVDFKQVKMDEEMQTKIPLVFVGESKAVKESGGTLIKSLEELEIACLPANLIHELEVSIDVLETFDDVIHVKDLEIPGQVSVLTNLDQVIASVTPIKIEVKAEVKKEEEVEAEAEEGAEGKAKKEEKVKEEARAEEGKSSEKSVVERSEGKKE